MNRTPENVIETVLRHNRYRISDHSLSDAILRALGEAGFSVEDTLADEWTKYGEPLPGTEE